VTTLVAKLLRDLRTPLFVLALLLGGFQCLWVKIAQRIVTEISPFFANLTQMAGVRSDIIEERLFSGTGKIMQTLAGGERIRFERAMDMLSVGYVHPLMQIIFCIWAIGRAAGAIAGELDKGTMELLLAQPLARTRVVLSHLCVDLVTIPLLCLSLWGGTWLGTKIVGPFEVDPKVMEDMRTKAEAATKEGTASGSGMQRVVESFLRRAQTTTPATPPDLHVDVTAFASGLVNIGAFMFAVSGYTMWLSSAGRFRWHVMGLAVLVTLLQFALNLVGQLWDVLEPLRPLSVFYYFQPQQVILNHAWNVNFSAWNGGKPLVQVPVVAVLLAVGGFGYAMALRTFSRRDLPAPL
jgi:ABC-2 type transport system permease protein